MTEPNPSTSRRDFLKTTGTVVGASALAGVAIPSVHAGEDNTIRVALVGCGGRGTGAAANALSTTSGPIKLVAMADVFDNRMEDSYEELKEQMGDKVDVSEDHQFIGFDAYQKAMDCLRPGDVVILATPPAFRWVQFSYAIEKGLNVFMEKPVTVDGPTTRKMLELGEEAKKKNLKVGVGLMCRHCEAREELFKRIKEGEIGDIVMLRAYRLTGPVGSALLRSQARRHQRAVLSDPEVPRIPLGQRRLLQRFPDPQHRRMLLDEGRLADQGEGHRRPALSRRLRRSELRHLLRRIHLRRRGEAVPRRPQHARLPPGIRQLRARHQGLGGHFLELAHARQVPDLQGPELHQAQTSSGPSRSPSRTRISSNGTT